MIDLGQTVGNYRITAKLGEGGMGVVFLAEHPVIARRAALKAIHPEVATSPEVIERFVNEAKLISGIGHEHIVEVTDFGRTEAGDFYFIMEHLRGESLAEALQRDGAMEPARALAIAAQIAEALEASHTRGVVHRDLKPENVFLVRRGGTRDFVKVLDFGLATLITRDDATTSQPTAANVMGTPFYMAPEQCEGRGEIDGRADVYALGCMLFELLTGMLPFGGNSSTQVLVKQVMMPPPAARSLVAGLPAAVDAILQRALAKDPADRYQTMAAFREALLDPAGATGAVPEAALEELSERVRRAQPMARGAVAAAGSRMSATRSTFRGAMGAIATTPGVGLGPARQGRAWLAVAGAAAAIVAIAAGRAAPSSAAAPVVAANEPDTVRLTFGSDPAGAEVVGGDGRRVGTTPLSIDLPASDAPARYVLRKSGFVAKAVALIPNVSSPVFVALEPTPSADPPPAPRARQAPRARHVASAHLINECAHARADNPPCPPSRPSGATASPPRLPPPPYEDDVLAPSFR